jgi:hypothetical protein
MKGLIILAVLLGAVLVVCLNPHLVADQVLTWAQQNAADPKTPEILFDTARSCEMLTDTDTATRVFTYIYQTYPDNAAFSAPAMYYCGKMKADSSYLKGIRAQAIPFLQIVIDQYPTQEEWVTKSKQLIDEVSK